MDSLCWAPTITGTGKMHQSRWNFKKILRADAALKARALSRSIVSIAWLLTSN